jgi:predicted DNA-binding protein
MLARKSGLSESAQSWGRTVKAFVHATDERGLASHISNPSRFNKRFEEKSLDLLNKVERKRKTPLGGEATEIEEGLFDLMSNFKMGKNRSFVALQRDKVDTSLSKKMPDFWENGLKEIIGQRNDEFFSDPNVGKIQNMIEEYGQNAEKNGYAHKIDLGNNKNKRKEFEDSIFDTLSDYANRKSKGFIGSTDELKEVERRTRENQISGFKKDHSEKAKSSWFSKMMEANGRRQATLGDILNHEKGSGRRGLFDKDSMRRPVKGEHKDADVGTKLYGMAKHDKEMNDLIADKNIFIDDKGEIFDMRSKAKSMDSFLSTVRDTTQIPFLRFNPLDLMHFSTREAVKNAPKNYFLRRDTIDAQLSDKAETNAHPMAHNQDAAVGTLAKDYMYSGGDVYDVLSGDKIKEDVYLTSARFGAFPRVNAGMANLHNVDTRNRSILGKMFDIGAQETNSVLSRMTSMATKFTDKNWGRNALPLHRRHMMEEMMGVPEDQRTGLSTESTFKKINSELEQRTKGLSDDAAQYLNSYVKEAYGDTEVDLENLKDFESIMGTLGKINNGTRTKDTDVYGYKLSKQISEVMSQYESNPTEFLKNKRILTDNAPYVPSDLAAVDVHETKLVNKLSDVKRLIHQHSIEQVEYHNSKAGTTVGSLIKEGIKSGDLGKQDLGDVRNLKNLSNVRQYWDDIYNKVEYKEEALDQFGKSLYDNEGAFEKSLNESMEDFNPNWAMGPGDEPPQYFGYTGFQTMNKGKGKNWGVENYNKLLEQGENPLKAMGKTAAEIIGQPFAGRRNMDKVTTATSVAYYMTERLDNAMAQVGLGLSQKNRGSMQGILFNQLGRRIALPYMAYQQGMYLDGLTGDFISDGLADGYANMHEDVGHVKEATGLNKVGEHISGMMPGLEQVGKWPIFAPVKHATFGLIGDNRSGDEIRKYYESGEDPIRKGRWWGIGSNTPWQGGKIDRYEPNWYRKIKSDYKFTDTMYGSEKEYWDNHWMPTLTNPLAPLNHFITDPDYWENKHKDSRPYPEKSGGFAELEMIPVVGSVLNSTVGEVLNPTTQRGDLEKHHRAYLEEINKSIASQYDAGSQGGYLEMMPAGGYNLTMAGEGGGGVGVSLGGGEGAVGAGTGPGADRSSGSGAATSQTREMLTMLNQNTTNGGPSLNAGGSPFGSVSSLDSLRDPDVVANLNDIGSMGSASGLARDSFYSLSEVAGIYGFSLKSLVGFEESGRGMTLDPSSRMDSYARAWWDLEMGGRGGMLSEIGRRYNPRDPNKNYWNPIRNEMPDWLPGVDYFTDFQHGDPFVKVPKGEMRLPGEAYESLNKLHPDAFGEYGAFDRFKILGDVAPYSKEYKFYRQTVSKMNQEGMLPESMVEEYAEVRDQVSNKKEKYNFYKRKFDYADINKEDVTVTKVIDANTFITEEYGMANPIKLAGVSVKADDEEAQSWLSQYIYEGAKVTVGLDADPLMRVRDDMMNTMRAVVYAGDNPEMPWYMSTKGQNVNNMLANRDFGAVMGMFGGHNNVTTKDDGSATSTRALYSDDQVTVGKVWETITHDLLPGAPVVGPIFDKFLQVRSPLEHYKKQEVYGKAWRSWSEPVKGWLQPMFESMAEKHPVVGAAQGAGIGWLTGKNKSGKFWGSRIGAVIGGGLSTLRVFNEQVNGLMGEDDAWLPDRRKKEREINQYFDKLKYVKYKGLYEKARKDAIREEGIDIEEILGASEDRGNSNKASRRILETTKKYLAISKELGYGDGEAVRRQMDEIRGQLKEINEDRPRGKLGEKSVLALRYRAEYESTLHGADPHGDMTKIFRALPSKDREYFTEFMNAAPEEREEILRLVPENQRRFYQAKWGLDVDQKEGLGNFFSEKHLPDEDWAGWQPGNSLESVKVKVARNEGLELTEFGLWDDDVKRADQSPIKPVQMGSISHRIEVGRLEKVLRGAGLDDVSISMTSAKGENKIDLALDVMKDRSTEMVNELNNNWGSILG